MKKLLLLTIWILLVSLYSGCKESSELESALLLAGDNRIELEKVLEYYKQSPSDSLKYKAACFLIENMLYHYYYEGEKLDKHLAFYELSDKRRNEAGFHPYMVRDSLRDALGSLSPRQLQLKYDIQELDSAFLYSQGNRMRIYQSKIES